MRHVPAHPASPHAAGHNGEASLVTNLSLDEPDVVKALALGGHAVLVGRTTLWTLATGLLAIDDTPRRRARGWALEPDRR